MDPKSSQPQTGELFGYPLRDHLNQKHPLILLGDRIQWEGNPPIFDRHQK